MIPKCKPGQWMALIGLGCVLSLLHWLAPLSLVSLVSLLYLFVLA